MIYDLIAIIGGACIVLVIAIKNDLDLFPTQDSKSVEGKKQ